MPCNFVIFQSKVVFKALFSFTRKLHISFPNKIYSKELINLSIKDRVVGIGSFPFTCRLLHAVLIN